MTCGVLLVLNMFSPNLATPTPPRCTLHITTSSDAARSRWSAARVEEWKKPYGFTIHLVCNLRYDCDCLALSSNKTECLLLLGTDRPLLRWRRFRGRDQHLLDSPGVQRAATLAAEVNNSTPSRESLRGCP